MADIVQTCIRAVGDVGLHCFAEFDRAVFDNTAHGSCPTDSLERVRILHDGEVGQADLERVAVDDGQQAKVFGVDLLLRDAQLEVAAVVDLGLLQFLVVGDEGLTVVDGLRERQVLAVGALARDGGAGKFDT
jgi:hypothetical protein